jgi:hypothetical protein
MAKFYMTLLPQYFVPSFFGVTIHELKPFTRFRESSNLHISTYIWNTTCNEKKVDDVLSIHRVSSIAEH